MYFNQIDSPLMPFRSENQIGAWYLICFKTLTADAPKEQKLLYQGQLSRQIKDTGSSAFSERFRLVFRRKSDNSLRFEVLPVLHSYALSAFDSSGFKSR